MHGRFRGGWGLLGMVGLALGVCPACAVTERTPPISDADASVGTPVTCAFGDAEPEQACDVWIDPSTEAMIELGPHGAQLQRDVHRVGEQRFVTESDATVSTGICASFGNVLGEDLSLTAELLDPADADLSAYSVYRPAHLAEGERYPVIAWSNGICSPPETYGTLLRYVASYGFIVVAPNSRLPDASDLVQGIDLVFALDDEADGPLQGHVDRTRAAVMAHSQGTQPANAAARMDARIKAAILLNGIHPPTEPELPYLAVAADYDLNQTTAEQMSSTLRAPGAFVYLHDTAGIGVLRGHLAVMLEPERVLELSVRFLRLVLQDDPEARPWFVGDDCQLCRPGLVRALKNFEFGEAGL